MSDIVTRAEEALAAEWVNPKSPTALCYIASELVAELKAARAERDQNLVDFTKNYTHLTMQLEAARAEAERLRLRSIWEGGPL
jgi:hypothetical protein